MSNEMNNMGKGYHIIMDSVGDVTEELTASNHISLVPLKIMIDGEEFVDDDQLSQSFLLSKIASAKECPTSACPSPDEYRNIFEKHKEDRIYVITASSKLTGSYNSAQLGKKLLCEDFPNTQIEVFDSKSASAGETLLAYKAIELENKYDNFETTVRELNQFIKEQEIIFVLEDLTFLQKNGRLSGIKGLMAEVLNIVPILSTDEEGTIFQMGKERGIKKAIKKLKESVGSGIRKGSKALLVISHCNCLERAVDIKDYLLALFPELDIIIANTGGISTLYAGDRGIVVSY